MSFLEELEDKLALDDLDLSKLSGDDQFELLKSRAVHIVKEDLLKKRLNESKKTGRPLRVKYGIDPTSPDAHLGHAVPVILARRLQQMGHHVIILFGDFTALVGDPSGRVKGRPVLTPDDVRRNVSSYSNQIGKLIDMSKVETVYNSPFYTEMSILELLQYYKNNKITPIMQREDFRQRAEGLTIAEALYPTLMAIDSIKLRADIELGGNDQLINFHTAVAFMESVNMEPQSSLTTDLLMGTSGDGRKMSKSEDNYIALTEPADQAFGKVMSIPDSLLEHYFKLLTDITDSDWKRIETEMSSGELNPINVKKLLARYIVGLLHSREAAREVQQAFEKVFSRHALPDDMPEFSIARNGEITNVVDLVLHCGFAATRSEVRRLAESDAIRSVIDGESAILKDSFGKLPNADSWVLKVGKRRFAKINWTEN